MGFCQLHNSNFNIGQCVCEPPFTLYPFPTERQDPAARKRWITNINRKNIKTGKIWQPAAFSRVCSAHFKENKPSEMYPDPVLNMGHQEVKEIKAARRKLKRDYSPGTPPMKNDINQPSDQLPDGLWCVQENYRVDVLGPLPTLEEVLTSVDLDHTYALDEVECENDKCIKREKKMSEMAEYGEKELREIKERKAVYMKLLTSDDKVKFYTGLPSMECFNWVLEYIEPKVVKMQYWNPHVQISSKPKGSPRKLGKKRGKSRVLEVKDEFLLVLMKLRLNLMMRDLGGRFLIFS